MSRATKTLLIVLSVALNVAFVTSWALHRLPLACRHHATAESAAGTQFTCPLQQRIQATPAQRQEIETRLQTFRTNSMPLCMEVNRHRVELIDLLAANLVGGVLVQSQVGFNLLEDFFHGV